jgi:hypothetical protein
MSTAQSSWLSGECMRQPSPSTTGLADFEDMSFVLHLLTDEDLFGDVGANVGVYCVLASRVRGAKSVAMEPVSNTTEALRLNVAINELRGLVDILEIGVGAEPGPPILATPISVGKGRTSTPEGKTARALSEVFQRHA